MFTIFLLPITTYIIYIRFYIRSNNVNVSTISSDVSILQVGSGRLGNRPSGGIGSGSILPLTDTKGRQLFSKLQSHRFSQKKLSL